MSAYIRPRIPGASVFFTVALADRKGWLLVDHAELLRESVRATMTERPFHIDAWVVWRLIKARFSRALPPGPLRPSHEARQERGIWQRRFWEHHIRNEADLGAYIRYCWWNPVKHGLVERPADWPYSSVHRDIREGRYGW
ncbi:MAG: transposase [Tabrizicola sp.]|nr:transposase [Tabrizicola sp.]